MTTIVGLCNKHGAVIAGDSKITTIDQTGYISQINTLPKTMTKVIKNKGWIIGASGDLRAINLIEHAFKPTKPPEDPNKLTHHIVNNFIPQLRKTFDDHGYSTPTRDSGNHVAEHSSTILIAAKGKIFAIDGDYSVLEDNEGIYALGTGTQYALGYLHAYIRHIPESRTTALETLANAALNAAAHWDPHTGPPNHLQTQTRNP